MTGNRKDDHVRLAVRQHTPGAGNEFDYVNFVHHALAGIDRAEVDLHTVVAGMRWRAPLYINAMTGGSTGTGRINRDLAIAARETGLAVATGSMSAYFRDSSTADTFRVVRRENPHGFVMANVSAGTTADDACRAIELVEADALQIHLNAVQETIMPEGDRSFGDWPKQIEQIVAAVGVPVIVKEVGFGMSRETVALLTDLGVAAVDVGGRGGTNFARIENDRRALRDFEYLTGWGQSAPASLLDCLGGAQIPLLSSGGVRHPLDIVRSLALGAAAVGASGPFLSVLVEGDVAALITHISSWLDQLVGIMTVLGARTPAELAETDLLITGALREFCQARGIDIGGYGCRSRTGDRVRQKLAIEEDVNP
ncbi:type 2 isopentenyl-diphosphate Delta-isomerase [Nocardia transvalensis]|uniref:type 2 isopentenyl-diphosphate Delta-isomerase n=1 Tax=Nocardia transvalensis TaxID=37333 RepID=UPI00189561A1|nr:type 2 isopentenyl-diphosphate Delta-isomerase [Nocardia transvalensis]MBF6329421.1 type 2 isopentenyl-diphosphate Delta-isomerase [Nocardia transvalensis]